MQNALYILGLDSYELIYGPQEREDIAGLVHVFAPAQTGESILKDPSLLADVEVIFSGWGAPKFDEEFLAAAKNLRAVFYGAGSVRGIVTDSFWQRDILLTSAWAANAIPVAEYTLATVLFSLKRGWHFVMQAKRDGKHVPQMEVPGAYGSVVGLVSLGMVGRKVAELLRPFDVHVRAFDPFISHEDAAALGVELVSLDALFRESDVVSLHAPWLKTTEGMITGAHFASMKQGATFINTARGAIVREAEMIEVLKQRPDLTAVLDVTWPEPPEPGSPLYSLPNVILTPHIAGAMNRECRRMGRLIVDELKRYLEGTPLKYQITREKALLLA